MENAARKARRYCCIPMVHNELWNFEKVTVSSPLSAAGIIFLESQHWDGRCENLDFEKEIDGEILLSACDWKSWGCNKLRLAIKNLHIYLRFIIYIEYRRLSLFTSKMLTRKTEISSDGDKYRIFILLITTPYSILTSISIAERQRGKWHLTSFFAENGWILDSRRE